MHRPLLAILTVALLAASADAIPIYTNDFESSVGSGWSSTGGSLLIATTPSGRCFLGRHSSDGLNSEAVTLSLAGLPAHTQIELSFDLYLIRSWDGNSYDIDEWGVGLAGEADLLHTTFSSSWARFNQAYPDPYPGGEHPWGTGAAEVGTLGYTYGDAVYNLSLAFPHTGPSLAIRRLPPDLHLASNPSKSIWQRPRPSARIAGCSAT